MQGQTSDAAALDAADRAALTTSALFAALEPGLARELLAPARVHGHEAGQLIFCEGDRADALYVVIEGWVKLYRLTPSGEEAIVGAFTRGESFAEPVFFLGGGYPASAEAASRARLLRIDAARFGAAIERRPELASAILASIVFHTERLSAEIASLKLLSTPRRLADFLARSSREGAERAEIVLPHEKTLLAGRLGMTPESLSRALAALRAVGVSVQRDRIVVADLEALRAFARSSRRGAA